MRNIPNLLKVYNPNEEELRQQREQSIKEHERAASGIDTQNLDSLVNGAYFQGIRLTVGAGLYLVWDSSRKVFALGPSSSWMLTQGYYNNYRAYWIWNPSDQEDYKTYKEGRCWTNPGGPNSGGVLSFWDQDGTAQYPPQDYELFHFEYADQEAGFVRIRNYQYYVFYRGDGLFALGAGAGGAQSFAVEFVLQDQDRRMIRVVRSAVK